MSEIIFLKIFPWWKLNDTLDNFNFILLKCSLKFLCHCTFRYSNINVSCRTIHRFLLHHFNKQEYS